MKISGFEAVFIFGCLGGVAIELLRWWKLRESEDFPVYARKLSYWFLTVAMIVVGGLIAAAYGTESTTAILSMNLGASAPAIIGTLATSPKSSPSQETRHFGGSASTPALGRLRSFLAFGR